MIAAWARRRRSGRAQLSVAPIPTLHSTLGRSAIVSYSNQKIARVETKNPARHAAERGVVTTEFWMGSNASTLQTRRSWRVKASGCCCFFGDYLGHRPVLREYPAFASWDISGGRRGFDLPPSAMSRESNHGIRTRAQAPQVLQVASEYVAGQTAIRLPAGVCRGRRAVRSRHSPIVSAHSSRRLLNRCRTARRA